MSDKLNSAFIAPRLPGHNVCEWAWLCSNETLLIDTEHSYSYNFHLFSSILPTPPPTHSHLKIQENILSLQAVQIQIWPMDHSLPIIFVDFSLQAGRFFANGRKQNVCYYKIIQLKE